MRLLEVLKEYPEGKEFLKRRERVLALIQGLRDDVARSHVEYQQAVEQWHKDTQEANDAARVGPAPPTPLDPVAEQQVMDRIREEERRLQEDETDVVCALAAEIKVRLFEQESNRKERLHPHVAALEEEAREAAADLHLLQEVLMAEQKRLTAIPRPSPVERLITTVTPERLLACMQYDTSLMDLEPVNRRASPFESDPSEITFTRQGDGVRLGLSGEGGGQFGPTPDWLRRPG